MVPNETYKLIFKDVKGGQVILEELTQLFYNRMSYVKGDPYETAFREGHREVIQFILTKMTI